MQFYFSSLADLLDIDRSLSKQPADFLFIFFSCLLCADVCIRCVLEIYYSKQNIRSSNVIFGIVCFMHAKQLWIPSTMVHKLMCDFPNRRISNRMACKAFYFSFASVWNSRTLAHLSQCEPFRSYVCVFFLCSFVFLFCVSHYWYAFHGFALDFK